MFLKFSEAINVLKISEAINVFEIFRSNEWGFMSNKYF